MLEQHPHSDHLQYLLGPNACNPEDGGNTFHLTIGIKLQHCAMPQSEQLLL